MSSENESGSPNANGNEHELEVVVEGDENRPVPTRTNSQEALRLTWQNITIKHKDKELLRGVSGSVKGRFLAIMGGSGSGKTTLLNYLARRLNPGIVQEKGISSLEGTEYSNKILKQVSGYVVQDDLLFTNHTVEETLNYSAKLRLPRNLTDAQRKERVDYVIDKLGLAHCRQTIIGDELKRGVSGGERKRVCVAIELLVNPSILMLDEPTSGLDSASALSLCQNLKNLASSGLCTVICTIHQPQSKIFQLFDDLLILNKGTVLYHGPTEKVINFYERAGLPCPMYTNPADHILDVITDVSGADHEQIQYNIKQLLQQKERDETSEEEEEEESEVEETTYKGKSLSKDRDQKASWATQVNVLFQRALIDTIRNKSVLYAQLINILLMSILIGTAFLDLGLSQGSITKRNAALFFCVINQGMFGALIVINLFPSERKIVLRERAAGSYYASSYYVAKIMADTIVQISSPILFSCIVYFLVGFQREAGKFFIFTAFMILCTLAAISLALFVSTVGRTTTMAVCILPIALEVTRLFGGYFLPPSTEPGYYIWLSSLSYAKYSYLGIAQVEYGGLEFECPSGNCAITTGDQQIAFLELDWASVPVCAAALIGYIILFRVGAYICIRTIKW